MRIVSLNISILLKSLLILLIVGVLSFASLQKITYVADIPDSTVKEYARMNDFVVYYGASLIAASNPEKLYDPKLNEETQYGLTNKHKDDLSPIHYLYPPYTLLFFAPLHYFPYVTAFYLWQAAMGICSLLVLAMFYYAGICKNFKSLLFASFLMASSLPYMSGVAEGQTVMLMLAGLLGCQLLCRYKYFALAGFLLVITAFKPQLVIAPTLYLLIIYGASLWRSAIASGLAIMGICTSIFGIYIWSDFLHAITSAGNDATFIKLVLTKMCNLRMVLLWIFGPENFSAVNMASLLMLGVGVIISGWLGLRARNQSQEVQELGFALVIAISLFLSPWLHIHTMILLAIPIGYLLKYSGKKMLCAVIFSLAVLNPFLSALLFPGLTESYLGMNLALWVPAQLLLIAAIALRIFKPKSVG